MAVRGVGFTRVKRYIIPYDGIVCMTHPIMRKNIFPGLTA
jgi:hypothetical protein